MACRIGLIATVLCVVLPWAAAAADDDPFLWLEDVQGEKALAWVKEHNARTTKVLEAAPEFAPTRKRTLEILDSKDKIPSPELLGSTVYNFWRDDVHERGIWRRTTLASYRTASPAWETVLDVDALAKADGVAWVFHGAQCLAPDYRQCMISLSRGGSDASVEREFDTVSKQFVAGGFSLPEAKSEVSWRDENTLWVGTDFGPGSLTASGYPRVVKLWKRGTPLAEARTVFEGKAEDVASSGRTEILADGRYDVVTRVPAFFRQETFLLFGDRLVKLDVPDDAQPRAFFRDRALFSLRSDWTVGGATYRAGSLLAIPLDELLRGGRRFDVLFEPSERVSLAGVTRTRDRLLVMILDHVHSRLSSVTLEGGAWEAGRLPAPGHRHRLPGGIERRGGHVLPLLPGLPHPGLALARRGRRAARAGEDDAGVLRRGRCQGRAARGDLQGRDKDPLLRRHAQGFQGRRRGAGAALRLRRVRGSRGAEVLGRHRLGVARPRRRSTSSPTSAAAASSGPRGTRRRRRPTICGTSRTSPPWPRT